MLSGRRERRRWPEGSSPNRSTWYEPFTAIDDIRRAVHWALQEPQLGTGHAVQQAMPHLDADTVYRLASARDPRIHRATVYRTLNRLKKLGLVDELADTPADVLPAALAWCEQHLALPRHALALSRAMVRADLHAIFGNYSASENEAWVELWFSEATQATLQKLVASLGK